MTDKPASFGEVVDGLSRAVGMTLCLIAGLYLVWSAIFHYTPRGPSLEIVVGTCVVGFGMLLSSIADNLAKVVDRTDHSPRTGRGCHLAPARKSVSGRCASDD